MNRYPRKDAYEPIDYALIPAGTKWKPAAPYTGNTRAFISLFGGQYKLIRDLTTGEVTYYTLKDKGPPATPKEQIDAEPEHPKQQRFRTGVHCWYVDDAGRWFCCLVESRGENSIVLRSITGWDAERLTAWPFGDGPVEISDRSQAFKRIRKLKDRVA